MAIKMLLVNMKVNPPEFEAFMVNWFAGITAEQIILDTLGNNALEQIKNDLFMNEEDLTVSWVNIQTEEHSEIGGVSSLDWEIPNNSILSIVYENRLVDQSILDSSNQWMIQHYEEMR